MTSFSKNVFSLEVVPRLLPEPRRDVTDEEAEIVYFHIQRPEYSNETIDVGIGECYSFVDEDGEPTHELGQFIEDQNLGSFEHFFLISITQNYQNEPFTEWNKILKETYKAVKDGAYSTVEEGKIPYAGKWNPPQVHNQFLDITIVETDRTEAEIVEIQRRLRDGKSTIETPRRRQKAIYEITNTEDSLETREIQIVPSGQTINEEFA